MKVPPSRTAAVEGPRTLRTGFGSAPDLRWEPDLGVHGAVVKDYGKRSPVSRVLGRIQIAREVAAYRALADVPAVPNWVGRLGPYAIAIERIGGPPLAFAADRFDRGRAYLASLRRAIDAMHARGVAHLDLRGRDNVLVRADGTVAIVDFGGAVCLRPGSILHRVCFPAFRRIDEAAYLKWKALLAPGDFTPEELRSFDRHRQVRRWWPFPRAGRSIG